MNIPPVVSICIANYNGESFIAECLDAVLRQEDAPAYEIIVHDDASTDGSVAFIRERYPSVTLIESDRNVGFCVANNRMAARARGRFLLLLNNDATLFPDAVRTLAGEAERIGSPAILSLPQYDAATGQLIDMGCLLDPFLNPIPNLYPGRRNVGMVIGACLWLPKALWDTLGGFPEWFGSIGEDLYLCCRARLGGHPVIALARSGYRHRVGASFGGGKPSFNRLATTKSRRSLSERNKSYVICMTYPGAWLALLLPIHALTLLLEGIVLSAIHRDLSLLTDIYLAALRALPGQSGTLRAMRTQIQSGRRASAAAFFSAFTPFPHKLRLLFRHGIPRIR